MKYLSRRYGVYRVANEQYMLSTMTAGIRHPDHRVQPSKKKRIAMTVINKACRRYHALFFISVAAFSAAQGFMLLMFLSTFLLVASLLQSYLAADLN